MGRLTAILFLFSMGVHDAAAYDWCPPSPGEMKVVKEDCAFGVSRREASARRDAWFEARRAEARQLAVDYEDVLVAVLTNGVYREDSYCLDVFDAKPSKSLTRRLKALGRKSNDCFVQVRIDKRFVYRISQVSPERFAVHYQAYCGAFCAREWLVTVRRNANGRLVIEKEEPLWTSGAEATVPPT